MKILVTLVLVVCATVSFGQSYPMSNTTITACTGTFYDPGGTGNYTNGATQTMTIMPGAAGDGVCLDFTTWVVDYSIFGWSTITFYDGMDATAPLIMEATGDWLTNPSGTDYDFTGPGMVCATGPMTIVFDPDDNDQGWEADISCYTPLPPGSGCNVSVTSSSTSICPGQSVTLNAGGNLVNTPLANDFNDGTIGTGWSSTVAARYDNPCGPGLDGTSHLWMGVEPSPRSLTSNVMDVSAGGQICFDFKMATQADASPCEGPDLDNEGVYLQYSIDGGTTWITIHYFYPPFYTDGSEHATSWQRYNFMVPAAAMTATSQFRWHQQKISSASTDHWGVDNIIIGIPTTSAYSWDNGLSSALTHVVSPATTTTYNITLSDGSLECTAGVTVSVTACGGCTLASTAAKTDASCNGGADGTASVTASGGTTPYTYLWNNAQTTSALSGLSAGTYTVTVFDNSTCTDVQSVVVGQPTAFTNSISCVNTSVIGGNDGSSSSTVGGGTATYSYLWSTTETTANVGGLSAGVISMTATDAEGCIAIAVCTVEDPFCPASVGTVSVTGGTNIGGNEYNLNDGESIDFATSGEDLTGGLTYGWAVFTCDPGLPLSAGELANLFTHACYLGSDYGTTTNDFNNAGGSGTLGGIDPVWIVPYTSDVANAVDNDGDGCYDIGDVIRINYLTCAMTNSDFAQDMSCNGANDGMASVTASNGTTPYTYQWTNAANTASISGLSAGTYGVTVTDNLGCTTTTSVVVANPTVLAASVNCTNTTTIGGSDGSSTSTVSGGTGSYTYNWSTGANTANVTGLSAGPVSVTVSDANNCSVTAACNIVDPTCSADVGTISITGGTNVGGLVYDLNDGETINFSASGEDVSNGLTYGWAVFTCDPGLPLSAGELANLNTHACYLGSDYGTTTSDFNTAGGSGTLGGADPVWIVPYTSDVSNAVDQNGDGCYDIGDVIQINYLFCAMTNTMSGQDVTCNGGADGTAAVVAANGTLPYTYDWSNGANTSSLTGLSGGGLTVTVTDNLGCSTIGTVSVSEPTPTTMTLTGVDPSCGNNNGSVTAAVTGGSGTFGYTWSNGGTSASITNVGSALFTVTMTEGSCETVQSLSLSNPLPNLAIDNAVSVTCNGNVWGNTAVVNGGTTPYVFAWSTGDATNSMTGLGSGTFDVTVTEGSGCVMLQSFVVTEPSLLIFSAVATDVTCNGGADGTASAVAANGTPPYTYAWSDASTAVALTGLSGGMLSSTVTDALGCTNTASVTLTEPTATTLTVAGVDPSCGNANGSVSASVAGGSGSFGYVWSNGATTAAVSNLPSALYSVTMTEGSCTSVQSVSLSNPLPNMSVVASISVSCSGDSWNNTATVVGGTTPYSYNWSTGGVTATETGMGGGSFDVTVTEGSGCIMVQSFAVSEPNVLTLSVTGADLSCYESGDGSVSTAVNGGTLAYGYSWSNGSNASSLSGLDVGGYGVTVTDAQGCSTTGSYTLTSPTQITMTVTGTNLTCFGDDDGTVNAAVSGGTIGYTYGWSNGGNSASQSSLAAGNYFITLTDGAGCSAIDAYNVTTPAELVSNVVITDITCFGLGDGTATQNVTGGTTPYSFNWSVAGSTITVSGLQDGNLTASVQDANGCVNSQVVTVNEPAVLTASASTTDVDCNGTGNNGSMTLTVSGGVTNYNYQWSGGGSGASSNVLVSGSYTVTVSDQNGCSAVAGGTVAEPSLFPVDVSGPSNLCVNESDYQFTAATSGGDWSGSSLIDSDGLFSPNAAGSYDMTYTLDGYCGGSDNFTVVVSPLPTFEYEATDETCTGEDDGTIVLLGTSTTDTYMWDDGATDLVRDPIAPGVYGVTATTPEGCSLSQEITVLTSLDPCAHVFVANIFSPNGDGNNDQVYVRGKAIDNIKFVIYDRWGEQVFVSTSLNDGWDGMFRGEPVNTGVFVYHLYCTMNGVPHEQQGNITLIR